MPVDHVMIQEIIPGGGECQLSYAARAPRRRGARVPHRAENARDSRRLRSRQHVRRDRRPARGGRAERTAHRRSAPARARRGRVQARPAPNGALKLLDVNVRAWGWHSIGVAAGVDFPYLAGASRRVRRSSPCTRSVGVRWVRLTTDVPTSAREILGRRMKLGAYLRTLRPPLEGPISAVTIRGPVSWSCRSCSGAWPAGPRCSSGCSVGHSAECSGRRARAAHPQ